MSDAPRVRAHLFISGRVQGVFYRAATAEQARRRGLAGWVRNLFDGRVEAVFEGSRAGVEAMIEWCRQGPPHARVDEVQVEMGTPEGLASFEVRSSA